MKKTKRNPFVAGRLSKAPWWPKTNKAQGHENPRYRSHAGDLRPVSEKELFAIAAKNKKETT
tara:strand:- start:3920 stop:4105 length:186 start_codon:yes stop_codon:yes gene_type:complete